MTEEEQLATIKKLIEELNEEYGGSIVIGDIGQKSIRPSDVRYIDSIMDKVEPLFVDKPIVVSYDKRESKYDLIDGYHRLKGKLNDESIDVVVISKYKIEREAGELIDVLEQLIGKSITFITSKAFKVNKKLFHIETNEGCGGCGYGWSRIDVYSKHIGKQIKIKEVSELETDDPDLYILLVNGQMVAKLDYAYGNGYYGGGYKVVEVVNESRNYE